MAAVLLALLDNKPKEEASAFVGPNPDTYEKGDEEREEDEEGDDSKTIPVTSTNNITRMKDAKYLVFLVLFHPADILLLKLALVISNPFYSAYIKSFEMTIIFISHI